MPENDQPRIPAASWGLVPCRYVRISPLEVNGEKISIASIITGLTVRAMEQKIDSGVWKRDEVWIQGPDGKRYLDRVGYEKWVCRGRPQE